MPRSRQYRPRQPSRTLQPAFDLPKSDTFDSHMLHSAAPGDGHVVVRRSTRRTRSVSAQRQGDVTVVSIPARFTEDEELEWVTRMLQRLASQEQRRKPSDEQLMDRARELSRQYFGGRARPVTVRWVTNQNSRWGSCTPADRSIRLSTRLKNMPGYVLDYVLLHELAHLLYAGHGPRFWALLAHYPHLDRARGFLDGVSWARGMPACDVDSMDDEGAGTEDAEAAA